MGKSHLPFHITGKQNDWEETVAMQEPSLITSMFKYSLFEKASPPENCNILFSKYKVTKLHFVLTMDCGPPSAALCSV